MAKITHEIMDAVEALNQGSLVAIPTETVYGLAGDIFNPTAIEQIFVLKKRPFFDPLIVHVASLEQAKSLVVGWPRAAEILAQKFWPGPLTLVLPKKSNVSDMITSGLPSVGIRIPSNPVALELLKKVGKPLAAPSANQFKKTSPTKPEHVLGEFKDSDLLILDGGDSEVGIESTVIGLNENGKMVTIEIYRPGMITAADIEAALVGFQVSVVKKSNPAAPGQMENHYMPTIPLYIFKNREHATDKLVLQQINKHKFTDLEINKNPAIAARELYSNLRKCAEGAAEYIRVFRDDVPTEPIWDALWDRLSRAATKDFSKGTAFFLL